MKDLTIIILGNKKNNNEEFIEIIYTNEKKLIDSIKKASGKYVLILREEDSIDTNYFDKIIEKTKLDFDCCIINYEILYSYKKKQKKLLNPDELKTRKPYYQEYIWSYIFNKEKLLKMMQIQNQEEFNQKVEEEFQKIEVIEDVIYYHNPQKIQKLKNSCYTDIKKERYAPNIIYVASGCNGIFNGYITWIKNIGSCYHEKYNIVILYDEIVEETKNIFEKYFPCWKRETDTNYLCDRLLVTYTSYFYPQNVISLEESYLFIHGNMSDYENVISYHDDIYSHYVAVSKITAEKAKGYFPTDNIEYVLNPLKIEKEDLKPHLKLVSTFRYCTVKRPERVEKMARLMTELNIPYTWELFTDQKENTNQEGLIFRQRVSNPLPYITDSDYFVLLSDSEACSYSILEAVSLNVKLIVTPVENFKELGVKDNENAIVIPFEYFDDNQEEKLKEIILKIYEDKRKSTTYSAKDYIREEYNQIFT